QHSGDGEDVSDVIVHDQSSFARQRRVRSGPNIRTSVGAIPGRGGSRYWPGRGGLGGGKRRSRRVGLRRGVDLRQEQHEGAAFAGSAADQSEFSSQERGNLA